MVSDTHRRVAALASPLWASPEMRSPVRLSKAYLQALAVHTVAAAAEERTFTDKIEHLVSADGCILEEKIGKT